MEWDRTRIRAFRAAFRLPRDKFAYRLGAAPKTVRNWEDGRNVPGLALLRALDEAWESATPEQRERFLALLPPAEEAPERGAGFGGKMVPAITPDRLERAAAGWDDAFGVHQKVADGEPGGGSTAHVLSRREELAALAALPLALCTSIQQGSRPAPPPRCFSPAAPPASPPAGIS